MRFEADYLVPMTDHQPAPFEMECLCLLTSCHRCGFPVVIEPAAAQLIVSKFPACASAVRSSFRLQRIHIS